MGPGSPRLTTCLRDVQPAHLHFLHQLIHLDTHQEPGLQGSARGIVFHKVVLTLLSGVQKSCAVPGRAMPGGGDGPTPLSSTYCSEPYPPGLLPIGMGGGGRGKGQ